MKYTDEQWEAVTTDLRRVCVDAGAGSGKTRILVDRMVHLLGHRERWKGRTPRLDRIVAITFMEKAAAEMKARLRKAFRKQAMEFRQEANWWRELERNVDTARVSTIHAFCTAFLRENALYLGMDPEMGVMDDTDTAILTRDTISSTLHRMLTQNHPGAVHLALTAGLPALREILYKILRQRSLFARLTEDPCYENADLLRTAWMNVCTEEEKERFAALAHSREVRQILRDLESSGGFCEDPEESREKQRALAEALFRTLASGKATPEETAPHRALLTEKWKNASKKNWTDTAAYETAGEALKQAKKFLYVLEEANPQKADAAFEKEAAFSTCALAAVAREILADHQAAKAAMNAIDYDDMIDRTCRALREHPAIRKRTAESMAYLLIDEFQDTDHVQLEIARLLAEEENGPALFVVGDAKQSIYLFRGAEVDVFSQERARSHRIPLQTNFRSLPDVLYFVNDLFRVSGALSEVEAYRDLDTHRSARGAQQIECFVPFPEDPDTKWTQEEQIAAEAEFIARRIREMVDGPEPLQIPEAAEETLRSVRYGDMAILFRRGTHTYQYEEALRKAGVPYCRVAGSGFYERQEILDLIFLLEVIVDPWDEEALIAFLRGPFAMLSDDELVRIRMRGSIPRIFNADTLDPELPAPLRQAHRLILELRASKLLSAGDFLRHIVETTHYEAILSGQYQGLQKVSNIRKMIETADAFSRKRPAGLQGFVDFIVETRGANSREGEANLQTEGGDAVVLLTVHKSKGLEFPVVFLPETSSGRKSNTDALLMHRRLGIAVKIENEHGENAFGMMGKAMQWRKNREEEAESARTLYVALTRARDYLVLCGSPKPDKGSWFALIDEAFGCTHRPHQSSFSGPSGKWRAVVRRKSPPEPVIPDLSTTKAALPENWREAIAPLPPSHQKPSSFSVSFLLNRMCAIQEAEEHPDIPVENIEADSASIIPPGAEAAMARGIIAHRFFECWEFNAALPDSDSILSALRVPLDQRGPLAADLRQMADRFTQQPIFRQLQTAAALQREIPFCLRIGAAIIRGTIDLRIGNQALLDYKTGKPSPHKAERYALQIALYALAVAEITGFPPAEGWIYYVDTGDLIPVAITEEILRSTRDRVEKAVAAILAGSDL